MTTQSGRMTHDGNHRPQVHPGSQGPNAVHPLHRPVGEENDTPVFGPCAGLTRSTPGDDAKLKSTLLRLYVANQPYVVIDGDTRTESDPMRKAAERSCQHFLDRAMDRAEQAAAKAAKHTEEATPKVAAPATPAKTRKTTKKENAA